MNNVKGSKKSVNKDEQIICHEYNAAINFAIDDAGLEGILFLKLWREGDWPGIAKGFPEFNEKYPNTLKGLTNV